MQRNSGLLDPKHLHSAMYGFGGVAVHPQQSVPSMLATAARRPETPAEPAPETMADSDAASDVLAKEAASLQFIQLSRRAHTMTTAGIQAKAWLRAHEGKPTEEDDLLELKSTNPKAFSIVQALLMQRNSGLLDPKHLHSAMYGFGGVAVHPQQSVPSMLATAARRPETPAEPAPETMADSDAASDVLAKEAASLQF